MDVRRRAADVDAALRARADPERAVQEKAYLKSDLEHYGCTVPAVRAVVKEVVVERLDHDALVALAAALWEAPVHERRAAAAELLEQHREVLGPDDLPLLERLIRESRTWALVDNLAASVVGPLLERHAEASDVLDRWVADPDFWVRRAALLALLLPLREGRGDLDRFLRYADALLDDEETFIRKAIGWVLRDTGRLRPDAVTAWLLPRAGRAAGLTVREAVKRLPPEQRDAVLRASSASGPRRRSSGSG